MLDRSDPPPVDAVFSSYLKVEIQQRGRELAVAVRGELDAVSASLLRAELADLSSCDVTVDASDLTFIDSSGLRTFVALGKRAEQSGRKFSVINTQPQVHRVIEITGLLERLQVTQAPDDTRPLP